MTKLKNMKYLDFLSNLIWNEELCAFKQGMLAWYVVKRHAFMDIGILAQIFTPRLFVQLSVKQATKLS